MKQKYSHSKIREVFSAALWLAGLVALTIPLSACGEVNMKDGSYSQTWDDLALNSDHQHLYRTYNSRSLMDGMFGFGWCSDLEVNLDLTHENTLAVRDCTAPGGVLFHREPTSTIYEAENQPSDHIEVELGQYARHLPGGAIERFDKRGHLILKADSAGHSRSLVYDREGHLKATRDEEGHTLRFYYDHESRKVRLITGPGGLECRYGYDGDDLVRVLNPQHQAVSFRYDQLHNLTRIAAEHEAAILLTYDSDRDLLTGYRGQDGCIERYQYLMSPDDPRNHFVSQSLRRCGNKSIVTGRFEFWHQLRADGGTYLARVRISRDHNFTDVTYHPISGHPVSLNQNGHLTYYQYDQHANLTMVTGAHGQSVRFIYDDLAGQPSIIERPGVGSVRVTYDAAGAIRTVTSRDGPAVAFRVTHSMNDLFKTSGGI